MESNAQTKEGKAKMHRESIREMQTTEDSKIGNVEAIVAMLSELPFQVRDSSIVFGDDTSYRESFERNVMSEDRFSPERQKGLCKHQLEQNAAGYISLSLWTNIYGWACGSFANSNIRGGTASLTSRYATLEDCVAFAYKTIKGNSNKVLSIGISSKKIPQEIIETFVNA